MSRRSLSRGWAGPSGLIGSYISQETKKTLGAYRNQPDLILEHANHEEDTARGGYAHRQLFELVQNSADALAGSSGGRICIRLTSKYLYCADEGKPIDEDGVRALKSSHMSSKRGTAEIGRFGLGFKSVIGVTDCPEFFSRSGSFKFDRDESIRLIRSVVPSSERYPILRLPVAIDLERAVEDDPALHEFMGWATNIVRLPLKTRHRSYEELKQQITEFPQEFLLFVNHVSQLTMEVGGKVARTFSLNQRDEISILKDGENESQWLVVSDEHRLSEEAKSDRRSLDDVDDIQVSWAIPVNRLDSTGYFWAFFPTNTTSPLAGILNAPWKTNEDRQNLLTGVYNDELIDFAADLAARNITKLQTKDDPGRHLDALPRRLESGDSEHFSRLRSKLYKKLQDYELVPDQKGDLIHVEDALYPPKELTDSIDVDLFMSWTAYRYRPVEWLHIRALTLRRLARLDFLYRSYLENHMQQSPGSSTSIPRQSIAKWLEALTLHAKSAKRKGEPNWQELAIEASTAAIQTAVLIDERIRNYYNSLGSIVFTLHGNWVTPDPSKVFLSEDTEPHPGSETTHPHLCSNPESLRSLQQLGLQYLSREVAFKALLSEIKSDNICHWDDADWVHLWEQIRSIDPTKVADLIMINLKEHSQLSRKDWHDLLHVQTVSNRWFPLSKTLLPGSIVPRDGSRDSDVAVDLDFHGIDASLLQKLGVTDTPVSRHPLSSERYFQFLESCRTEFIWEISQNPNNRTPQRGKLRFLEINPYTSGPLDVFELLSEEGKLLYTDRLLDIHDTYKVWKMGHNSSTYGTQEFQSPAIEALTEYGRIQTERGILNLWEGLSPNPDSLVVETLLRHRNADQIVKAFDLCIEAQVSVEAVGEDESVPLIDIWPGLKLYLSGQQMSLRVVRCDELLQFGTGTNNPRLNCWLKDSTIYVVRQNEEEELQHILEELKMELEIFASIRDILEYKTPEEVEQARARIRECATDEERLLAAVGETALLERLPWGLLEIMEQDQGDLTDVQIAQAAIATFHTGALREYRHDLDHLDPPGQWAGSPKAVRFVQSLGFGEDWAGSKNIKRDPFVEVEGPYSLPSLHDFQRKIVDNVKNLIRSREDQSEGRGMISMPTGSGKTRVAVQAIVEAIEEGTFQGNILWIADRDELCEQAVEAWKQVWSSKGIEATPLRIYRMWGGQPEPLPTNDIHVVIASVQTTHSKIVSQRELPEFLLDLKLLVFDEAHRSIAPSYTTVMRELGLDRRRTSDEPILIGLTATPYRGHNEQETKRLVNRYGKNRLDAGAFLSEDPEKVVQELQDIEVLAKADHDTIEGGQFYLSNEELQKSEKVPWLPQSVENRIADDVQRTRRIVQTYLDRNKISRDWSTLIYATSVEHSQIIAALLVAKGITARAVSANTDPRTRRRAVEEFRNGEIKVLVNYGIFREGFDAPNTRAIIIARPVYSPNLYFQMIGRGLRGVKNGGNDRCLILDVNDNVVNFQKKLAFSDLDWLWDWTSSD